MARNPQRIQASIRHASGWRAGWRAALLGGLASSLSACGGRSSLLDFSSAGGGASSSVSSAGAGGSSSSVASAGAGAGGSCGNTQIDLANCGVCGAVCKGACMSGRCLVRLASEQMNVGCLALDASGVYWATADLGVSGAINKTSLNGGALTQLSATASPPWPCSMAVDARNVYWADGSDGSVLKAPLGGGAATTLVAGLNASAIAIDAKNLYFTGQYGYPSRVSLEGGAPTQLADVYGAQGVAIDATSLYWGVRDVDNRSGTIQKAPLGGGALTTLASGQTFPQYLVADAGQVYWTDYTAGTVQKISRDGGAVTTLAADQFNPSAIALDEANVYWSSLGSLMKVPKAGGAPTTLSTSSNIADIAVDATSVYWTDGSAILKLTPK
jgi:hypothetical protein